MGFLLAALLSGVLGFNAMATPEKAAQVMESALRKRYPGAEIKATVAGKRGRDVINGRFQSVRLEMSKIGAIDGVPLGAAVGKAKKLGQVGHFELALHDFTFDKTPVESAELTVDNVAYDFNALKNKNQLSVVQCGPGVAHIIVAADALESLLAEKFPTLKDLDLTMKDGQVRVSGKKVVPLINFPIPFHLTARLEVHNTNEIWVVDERVAFETVTGFSLPVSKLFESMNPVYAFDKEKKWPFAVQITSLTADSDKMDLKAALKYAAPANPAAPATPGTPVTPAVAQ